MTRTFLIGLSLAALIGPAAAGGAETVSGRARVLSGDTLAIGGRVLGLYGAAAPSLKQTCLDAKGRSYGCGAASARALAALVRETSVTCEIRETDGFGRALAVCVRDGARDSAEDGSKEKLDLSAWAIGEGHAVADRTRPSYLAAETPAWGRRKGLWAGSFDDLSHRRRIDYAHAVADMHAADETR